MSNVNFQKLVDKAEEMALHNLWDEKSYKINMAILKRDQNNCAACTRLAKYYKLHDNITEAKNMYLKALEIDPDSRGAMNNLNDIEKDQRENDAVAQIKTIGELVKEGQKSATKGKLGMAEKLFSRAFDMEPLLAHAVSLAGVYQKMGKYDSIEILYEKLIDGKQKKADIEEINNEFKALLPSKKSLPQ